MRWILCALIGGGLCWSCLDDAADPRPPAPDPQADGGTFDPDLIGFTGGGNGYGSGGAAGGGGQRPPPTVTDAAADAELADAGTTDAGSDASRVDAAEQDAAE